MSDPTTKDASPLPLPPYIPWKTFENFVAKWKGTTTPHTIDGSSMKGMAGGMQRQLKSALRFLGHVNGEGVVQAPFNALVKAHGTDAWADAVRDSVLPAYKSITNGLPIDNATASQLSEQFRSKGKADGQVGDKAIRFWLHAMSEAKQSVSPFFKMRQERSGNGKKATPRKKSPEPATGKKPVVPDTKGQVGGANPAAYTPPDGTISYPLHFRGKPEGVIVVPDDLSPGDLAVLQLQVDVIKALNSQDE